MKAGSPSRTAGWVAVARGLGRDLPPEGRLVDDPYGLEFQPPPSSRVQGWLFRLARGSRLMTGWLVYMQVRTRLIDDALRAWLAHGGRQVVLLGAGYDCRALRLPELADVRVIEVDHPATQGHKRAVLDRRGATSPAHYIAWNFEDRPMAELPDALAAVGLDRTQPVFTIWEGVTMYLTEPAIDASLRAIRAYSPAGSQLAMTYFLRSRVDQRSLRAIQVIVTRYGEPWRFGWERGALGAYLAVRGLALESDIAMPEAARRMLPADLARYVASDDQRFALVSAPDRHSEAS